MTLEVGMAMKKASGEDSPLWQGVMSHRTSWETPRGRYDEHNSKSSLSYDTKVESTSRRKKSLPKVVAS
jgi:hypothetical protein